MDLYKFDENNLKYIKTEEHNIKYKKTKRIFCFVFSFLAFILLSQIIQNKHISNELEISKNKNDSLINVIDEVTNECNYENIIKVKIGEYAMHPHKQKSEITKDSIASLLIELNAWYPDIIMAQVEIESSFGTSKLAKRTNNVVGMTRTTTRETTQLKGNSNEKFGIYNNWESCLIDRVLWDYATFGMKKPTRDEYISKLNAVYGGYGNYGNVMSENSKRFRRFFQF